MGEAVVNNVVEQLRSGWALSKIRWLDRHIKEQSAQWQKQGSFDSQLIKYAFYLIGIAIFLYCLNGYHTGFQFFQFLGLTVFSDPTWEKLTFIGDTLVALSICLMLAYRFPQLVFALLIAALAGTFLTHGMKDYFNATRPGGFYPTNEFFWLGELYKKCSFPSGHTLTAFTLAGLLCRCVERVRIKKIILSIAVVVGLSRVVVGAHWPIDVCVGAAGGLFCAWVGLRVADRFSEFMGARWYLFVCVLLVISAVKLFDYTGGFSSTMFFAQCISVIALVVWGGSWILHVARYMVVDSNAMTTSNEEVQQ